MTAEIKTLDTYTPAPLTTPEARVLHDATVSDEVSRCLTSESIVKAGKAFARSNVRKALRANFAGFTASEVIAHCTGE